MPFPTGGGKAIQPGETLPKQFSPTDPADKIRKGLGLPEQLQDALPSTVAQKMMNLVIAQTTILITPCLLRSTGRLNLFYIQGFQTATVVPFFCICCGCSNLEFL